MSNSFRYDPITSRERGPVGVCYSAFALGGCVWDAQSVLNLYRSGEVPEVGLLAIIERLDNEDLRSGLEWSTNLYTKEAEDNLEYNINVQVCPLQRGHGCRLKSRAPLSAARQWLPLIISAADRSLRGTD